MFIYYTDFELIIAIYFYYCRNMLNVIVETVNISDIHWFNLVSYLKIVYVYLYTCLTWIVYHVCVWFDIVPLTFIRKGWIGL